VAQVAMDSFEEGTEIIRVYLAASLGEAQRVEKILGDAGVEFAVEVEELAAGSILTSPLRRGAGFWVRAAALDGAADALERAGCLAGLVLRDAP
jgi:hypothetical protein